MLETKIAATTTTMDILHINETLTAVSAVEAEYTKSNETEKPNLIKKQEQNKQQQKTPNSTPAHKALKTNLFSWLKSATATTTPEYTAAIVNGTPNTKSADESIFRDFRGVQSLRHLWNKRISANAESQLNNKNKLTKSISCLVNASNLKGTDKSNIIDSGQIIQKGRPNRAQSLHDCRHLGNENIAPCFEIDTLHRVKDNFYKYKTAEQAAVHLARKGKRLTATGIIECDFRGEACSNFPAFMKSERGAGHIHWLKRHDINITKRKTESEKCNELTKESKNENMAIRDKHTKTKSNEILSAMNNGITTTSTNTMGITTTTTMQTTQTKQRQPNKNNEEDVTTIMPNTNTATPTPTPTPLSSDTDTTNSPAHTAISSHDSTAPESNDTPTRKQRTKNNKKRKGSLDSTSTPGRDSIVNVHRNTARRTSSTASNSSAGSRKYSFKTHTRNYHTSRKMHPHRDGSIATVVPTNGTAIINGGSLVAKLTQQFNDMIQKDKSLLDELRRKNGVLLTRGSHVYKVIDKYDPQQFKNTSPSISRTSSRGSKDSMAMAATSSPRTSVVQRNIKKFELSNTEKPKVPAKSSHVLRKHKEIILHRSVSNENQREYINKRQALNLPLTALAQQRTVNNTNETQITNGGTPKKSTHSMLLLSPPALEVVKEEAKTPIEHEDKLVNFKATIANTDTTTNLVTNVSTEKCANGTYSAARVIVNDIAEAEAGATNEQDELWHGYSTTNHLKNHEAVTVFTTPANEKQIEKVETVETVVSSSGSINQAASSNNDTFNTNQMNELKVEDIENGKQRSKQKYAKIYERFRFRSPFGSSGSQSKSKALHSTVSSTPGKQTTQTVSNEMSKETIQEPAAAKLLDALEAIDEKLKDLALIKATPTQQLNQQQTINERTINRTSAGFVLDESNDFEQQMLPNDSFIYKACQAKQVSNNQLVITQAVNVALVNSIEGEQMIMEQKELNNQKYNAESLYELITTKQIQSNENELKKDEMQSQAVIFKSQQKVMTATTPIDEKTTVTTPTSTTIFFLHKSHQQPEKQKQTEQQNLNNQTKTLETDALIDDIYQTVEETKLTPTIIATDVLCANKRLSVCSLNDYESIAGSCEHNTLEILKAEANATKTADDGYEICEPAAPDENNTTLLTQTTNTPLVRNTNDELPELPKPKRRLPKSPMPGKRPLPPNSNEVVCELESLQLPIADNDDEHHYYADDENIYDTIKGSHCYESLHAEIDKLQKSNSDSNKCTAIDNVSLSSNCYESITNYRRVLLTSNGGHATGSSSGSTLTISSDHKTNSLYEVSLAAGLLYGGGGIAIGGGGVGIGSVRTASSSAGSSADSGENAKGGLHLKAESNNVRSTSINAGGIDDGDDDGYDAGNQQAVASDNSEEWIDISESDAEDKQQFIVVRERFKVHRSPDWSKRVRDKRLQKKKAMSCIEDDSDHYYETLSPLGNKRHSTQLGMQFQTRNSSLGDVYNGRPNLALERTHKKPYASAHALGTVVTSDDYDSFDSDTDGLYDTEKGAETATGSLRKNHNDSGVDIPNVKLPDPPPTTNQVYAIVKKLKKFISNKKSPGSSSSKSGSGSQQKLYENTSQFYVEDNIYRNTPKSKSLSKINVKKVPMPITPTIAQDNYENTESHAPTNATNCCKTEITNNSTNLLSTSDKNLSSTHTSQTDLMQTTQSIPRCKSKSGKSFKSRLRKSLAGSISDSKQIPALTPTRSTFYIEDPSNLGYGELDSGFSEKASSGDLPVVGAPTNLTTPDSQKFSTARKSKKDAKSSQRRRTTIGIRPHEPPPPPPDDSVKAKYEKSTTSWYAECGVFKNGVGITDEALEESLLSGGSGGNKSTTYSQTGSTITNGTSWYTEAGLYQTSGISVASSSGSSGVSTGNEAGIGDDLPHSLFMNEPLYQIYNAAKLESISRGFDDNEGSTDGYEEIGQHANAPKSDDEVQRRSRPTALQLVGPKTGPSRTLWSEIPEVINSCILPTLTPRERALQEAKFEILTSEASYLKSLNLLRAHFMNHPIFRDTNIVSGRDRKALFSYIVPVHECSERLLTELESCWQDNIMLLGLSKRIYTVAEKYFHVYIAFCEHQGRMDRTLRRLKEAKGIFAQNLDLLESSPTCCGLNFHSFLMLPMQRITRLPLLIDAVFSKVSPNDDEYDNWKMTLAIMNKIVTQCNEAANRCEQAYEIERISRQLEFPQTIRALAIAPVGVPAPGSKPRFLVKKGELTHLIWRGDDIKLTFGKKFTKSLIFAFLFTDLLVLTKRKSEEQFTVFDYCPRNMLTISTSDALTQLPTKDLNQTGKNLILMTLLENHERKTVELVLSCPSVSEQERWLQAMRPPEGETPGEKLYEQWDCPQVVAKHSYKSDEPDVLNLEVGDVVNVTRKLPDGWYQGERLRDGTTGWFPGSYTEEVNSAHVRARNLKQRYRLLTFTATYLESKKQK